MSATENRRWRRIGASTEFMQRWPGADGTGRVAINLRFDLRPERRFGIFLDHVGGRGILVAFDPDADQVARDLVALRQAVQYLAGDEFLRRAVWIRYCGSGASPWAFSSKPGNTANPQCRVIIEVTYEAAGGENRIRRDAPWWRDIVSGLQNKIQSAIANITLSERLAEQHRKIAEPSWANS
jgi:hypothetical protein